MLYQIKNIKITKRILAIIAIIAILSALFIFVDIKILITVLLIEACELYIIFKILKREYPKPPQPSLLKPLTPKQVKELGIYINVDVTDCKNYKEASRIQELIINKKVKIDIFQNKKI